MSDEKSIHAKFQAAWSDIKKVEHDRQNPFLKTTYSTYDAIVAMLRPILTKHDLSFTQNPFPVEDTSKAGLRTLVRDSTGAEIDLGSVCVPVKDDKDPQAYKSAMTYGMRIGLLTAFAIPTGDDDDGNAAAEPGKDPRRKAYAAIAGWSGMTGDDLNSACKDVVLLAGSDPEKIIAYVEKHKGEDFMKHISTAKAAKEEA